MTAHKPSNWWFTLFGNPKTAHFLTHSLPIAPIAREKDSENPNATRALARICHLRSEAPAAHPAVSGLRGGAVGLLSAGRRQSQVLWKARQKIMTLKPRKETQTRRALGMDRPCRTRAPQKDSSHLRQWHPGSLASRGRQSKCVTLAGNKSAWSTRRSA